MTATPLPCGNAYDILRSLCIMTWVDIQDQRRVPPDKERLLTSENNLIFLWKKKAVHVHVQAALAFLGFDITDR